MPLLLPLATCFRGGGIGGFSGYSDIAIGTARLFGFNLMRNFNFPYFSRDIAEFWRRWHISLTTWFRDYIYIPLGGSRGGKLLSFRNTMIIFLVSGLWHGANWTFIAWGAFHALLFLPLLLLGKNRKNATGVVAENRVLPTLKEFGGMVFTFGLVVIGWIIFRADNIGMAVDYIGRIFSLSTLRQRQLLALISARRPVCAVTANEAISDLRVDYRWQAIDQENAEMELAREEGRKFTPHIFDNGDTRRQLLARSRHIVMKNRSKWTDSQAQRAEILFEQYPDCRSIRGVDGAYTYLVFP